MCPPYEPNIDLHDYRREQIHNYHQWQLRNPIQLNNLKAATRLKDSTQQAADQYGTNCLCFLTLTFRGKMSASDAMKAFKKATPALKQLFPRGILRVLATTDGTSFHFHLIVIVDSDIATDFDWIAYDCFKELSKKEKLLTPEEKQQLALAKLAIRGNSELRALSKTLKKKLLKYGFGSRMLLTPVRSVEATAKYMVGNYYDTVRALKTRGAAGRTRLIGFMGEFPVVNPSKSEVFQRRINRVLEALGLSREEMKERYGRYWCFLLIHPFGVLDEIRIQCGPDIENTPLERIRSVAERALNRPPARIRNKDGVWEWNPYATE